MKKKLLVIMCLLTVFIPFFEVEVLADSIYSDKSGIQPCADIIDWRYKKENGKVYKRKYNYSKQVWIGKWILVG